MRLGRRLGQRRATTGRARASSGPRRARRQSGGTDRRLTAERGLFGRSAEAEPHGQLSVERRRQRDHPLVAETYRLYGFDPEGGIPPFEALLQRIHPEDRGRFVDDLERAFRERANHEMIFRAVLPDGTLKYILGIGHPVFNASGDVVEFVGAAMDITERKRAEMELRESEQNYRVLFESIDEGYCTIEVLFDQNEKPVDYRFLQISPSFEWQTGIENAIGRRMREIAPQHEEHWFEIYGRIVLTGEPRRFENEAKQLGRWYDVYAFRVEDPKHRRVGILFNDITERKRAEVVGQRLAAIVECSEDAIISKDLNGTIESWNGRPRTASVP